MRRRLLRRQVFGGSRIDVAGERASTRELIEVIVLAFSRSGVKRVVSPDTLRMVLNVAYGALVPRGRLDLNVVWEMIANMPGLDREGATPPFCAIKSWEPKLGLPIDLPAHLTGMTAADVAEKAMTVPVNDADLSAARSRGGTPATDAHAEAEAGADAAVEDKPHAKQDRRAARQAAGVDPAQRRRRKLIVIGLGVLSIALFGFAGVILVRNLAGPRYAPVSIKNFAGPIPLRDVKQLGDQVVATLADESWLSLPDVERTRQLEGALRNLKPSNAKSLVIFDATQTVRASVHWSAGGHVIVKL
jgi:hypothetical protein